MNNNTKLYLVRHAPVKNLSGFIPENNPNAILNLDHIKKVASYLPNNCLWYVSPLKRTVQTAKALSKYLDFKSMRKEHKLVEQNFGDWAGKRVSYVWEELKHNKNQHNFSFICPETCPPNGDSYLDQCNRISRFIDDFNFNDKKSIVFITHAGVIRAILSHVLDLVPDKSIGIEISHLSITVIEIIKKNSNKYRGGRFKISNVNQQIF